MDFDKLKLMRSSAIFSPDREHRYCLFRNWSKDPFDWPKVAFIGLNPSTADESFNDPTVTRCIGFAKRWGYGGMVMLNAFAYRATDPNVMKAHADPIGPENDEYILRVVDYCDMVVLCWGVHGSHIGRDAHMGDLLHSFRDKLHCLGKTKGGSPKHPLYLKSTESPIGYYGESA